MIVKGLLSVEKCATQLLRKQNVFQSVMPEVKSAVTDVIQINKKASNIGFNQFCNIMKRNGINDFTKLDFENFIRFNRNNQNFEELISNPQKLQTFIERSRKMVDVSKTTDKQIYNALTTGLCEYEGVQFKVKVNENLLNDMESLIHTGTYFPKYSRNTNLQKIIRETKMGDVVSIDGKMFMNNGKALEELAFDEKTYTAFFPAVARFNTHQGNIGNCYFISQLEALMNSRRGRCNIYRMFSKDAKGNLCVQTAKNKCPIIVDKIPSQTPCQYGSGVGLSSIELAYGAGLHGIEPKTLSQISRDITMNENGWLLGGKIGLSDLLGKNVQVEKYVLDAKEIRRNIGDYLFQFANRDDYILQVKFFKHIPMYNILLKHQYSLKGYDKAKGIVTITNPHRSGLDIEIPESEILPYMERFSATKLV